MYLDRDRNATSRGRREIVEKGEKQGVSLALRKEGDRRRRKRWRGTIGVRAARYNLKIDPCSLIKPLTNSPRENREAGVLGGVGEACRLPGSTVIR